MFLGYALEGEWAVLSLIAGGWIRKTPNLHGFLNYSKRNFANRGTDHLHIGYKSFIMDIAGP